MKPMNRWRVYCGEDFCESFGSCMEAMKMVYDMIEMLPLPEAPPATKSQTYNLRDGEITVWEEGDPYDYTVQNR